MAHALWLLVLLKLVTPSLTWFPVPGGDVARQTAGEPIALLATSQPAAAMEPRPIVPADRVISPSTADLSPRDEDERDALVPPDEPAAAARAVVHWPWRTVLAATWLTGAALWWSAVGLAMVRFRGLVGSARPAPPEESARLAALSGRLGLRRVPTAWIVPARVPPMLWVPFFGPPRLLLPAELWGRLDAIQQQAILAHELAHLARRDHWVRRLEAAVLGLYWWDPVAWWCAPGGRAGGGRVLRRLGGGAASKGGGCLRRRSGGDGCVTVGDPAADADGSQRRGKARTDQEETRNDPVR